MAQYVTHKRTTEGRAQTLARRQIRADKYGTVTAKRMGK